MENNRIGTVVFLFLALAGAAAAAHWLFPGAPTEDQATVEPGSLLLFTQATCPPCRELEAMLHSGTVTDFLKQTGVRINEVDVQQQRNRDMVRKFQVEFTPTMVLLDKNGDKRAIVSGPMKAGTFMEWVRSNR